ncbi:MAG TPA: cob(I)yrinic acid a,c-diamide adenosyltransferase, partial [Gammaproteobacteria bacterium]|nr:cob(I)yrinic acid a,c-diamide adenosyltransferase [Gammaproteobacteria bacterium]
SLLGLLLTESDVPLAIRAALERVQHELFEIGAELSLPGYRKIAPEHVVALERDLDELNAALPPLKEFVLPGGNRSAALCHLARSVCRRAERRVWAAAKLHTVSDDVLSYLNRLSDFLFVAARSLARSNGGREVLWQHSR